MSGRFWMFVPVLLLGSTVAFAVWRVVIIVNDPSFAEDEQAYEKGLVWNEELTRRTTQAELGWNVRLIPPAAGVQGELQVRVAERDGSPVSGLHGSVQSFHNAYPSAVTRCELTEREPGLLVSAFTADRSGQWQWQVTLEGVGDTWHNTIRAEVAP